MSARYAEKSRNIAIAILRFLMTFTINTTRRLIILGHYTLACWQQQRLRRAWRKLGQRVHTALEEGEINPMLTDQVKDAMQQVQKLKGLKDRQYGAIAAIREKIRQSRIPESAAPPEEPAGREPKEKAAE